MKVQSHTAGSDCADAASNTHVVNNEARPVEEASLSHFGAYHHSLIDPKVSVPNRAQAAINIPEGFDDMIVNPSFLGYRGPNSKPPRH